MKAFVIGLLSCGVLLLGWQIVHFSWVIHWSNRRTDGNAYFGASAAERKKFKSLLRWHAALLTPLLSLLARMTPFRFDNASFDYKGVAGPRGGACSPESFARAAEYQCQGNEVFVVTQMRSGTTWMLYLVLQVLSRGRCDLAQAGIPLHAIAPWIESGKTIRTEAAPLVGEEAPRKVVKTHLPVSLCPWSKQAKYIYVVRHPVSCFASSLDHVRNNMRGFQIDEQETLRWFTSDKMWWGNWCAHLAGWWRRAQVADNVLLVRFEDMKQDLRSSVEAIAEFLELPMLSEQEIEQVLQRCSFASMKQHAELFEMHPPHLLQVPDQFFVNGRADRYKDVPAATRQALLDWCENELIDSELPIEAFYPDLMPTMPQPIGCA